MALTIVTPRQRIEHVSYALVFEWRHNPGAGFGFEADEHGKIADLNPIAAESLRKCLNGEYDVVRTGLKRHSHFYVESAEARCDCGALIVLDSFTNECNACGLLCNGYGQRLAPLSQWEDDELYHRFGPTNAPEDY